MEWIESTIHSNPVVFWFSTYMLTLLLFSLLGWGIGSIRLGLALALGVINTTSLVFATLFTRSQPPWVTACLFVMSILIFSSLFTSSNKKDEKEVKL